MSFTDTWPAQTPMIERKLAFLFGGSFYHVKFF